MDNEDVVYEDNENNSTSNLSDNVDNSDTAVSGESADNSKNSYDTRDNLRNRSARRLDNFSNGLRSLSNGVNKFANNRLKKNPDSKIGNAASKIGGGLNNASNRINRYNNAVQGVNNKVNTAEDAVEDPLGTVTDVAKDKVSEKAKEKVGEIKDRAKDAVKEGAKVAKEAVLTAIKPFLPWIIGGFLILLVILIVVSIIIVLIGNFSDGGDSSSVATGAGVCTYDVNGEQVSNLKVRLLNCEGNTPVADESLIDFEDYITGVVYQEVGDAPLEALKVQAIVARSFALTRPSTMNGAYGLSLKKDGEQWILSLRSCTNDQVFCNPDKGCWSLRPGGQTSDSNSADWVNCTVHSGDDSTKPWHRGPLDQNSKIRQAVEETKGMVLLNSNGKIAHTNFVDTNQKNWVSLANSGKDAFEILTKEYGSGKKLSTPNCTSADGNIDSSISSADVAAITNWDQKTAWKNLIGKITEERKPSVSKSTMDSRVTQVEVPMRKWTGSGSNPRTNTKKVMQKITVNKAIAPLWKAFFEDVYNNAPDFVIGSFDGCYVYRSVTGGGSLSAHAYGVACDINAGTKGNGYGTKSYTKERWAKLPNSRAKYQVVYRGSKVVQIAHKYTLINGSDWSGGGNDAMHFSFIRDWTRSQIIACKGKTSC